MITFPNAKINLGLSVIGKRKDEMHDINTCMIPVPIYDIIEIKRSATYSIHVLGPELDGSPETNSITRIWNVLNNLYPHITPVQVILYKNIPIGSGLGGGSSDAAFFLKLLNDFYKLNIKVKEMEEICKLIGSDCPFFIKNIPAIASGTGTTLLPLRNPLTGYFITIIYPFFKVSTKDAYENVIPSGQELKHVFDHPVQWQTQLKNDFERTLFRIFPELNEIKCELYKSGAIYSSVSGSGSSVYAVSKSPLCINSNFSDYRIFQFLMK